MGPLWNLPDSCPRDTLWCITLTTTPPYPVDPCQDPVSVFHRGRGMLVACLQSLLCQLIVHLHLHQLTAVWMPAAAPTPSLLALAWLLPRFRVGSLLLLPHGYGGPSSSLVPLPFASLPCGFIPPVGGSPVFTPHLFFSTSVVPSGTPGAHAFGGRGPVMP